MKFFNIEICDQDLKEIEFCWSNLKELPQYKYISRPVYKFFGGNQYPLISVPMAFAITHLIMHELPASLIETLMIEPEEPWSSSPTHIVLLLAWTSLSIPVAYVKYNRLHENEPAKTEDQSLLGRC